MWKTLSAALPCNSLTLLLCLCLSQFHFLGSLLFTGIPVLGIFLHQLVICRIKEWVKGREGFLIREPCCSQSTKSCLSFLFLNVILPLFPNLLTFMLVTPPSLIFGFGRSWEAGLDARSARLLLTQGNFILSDKYTIRSLQGCTWRALSFHAEFK